MAADYPVPPLPAVVGPSLYVLPGERAGREWLRGPGLERRDLIIIQPGNHRSMGPRRARWRRLNTDDKWWPPQRWAGSCSNAFMPRPRECADPVLRGSPEEVPMLEEIRSGARGPRRGRRHSLRELFALAEAAHSMISVDTGPAHAAAALSVPLVVLYGAESPS